MDSEIDPEDLVLLQRILDLREHAVQALLAGRLANALATAQQGLEASGRLKERQSVPTLLKDRFAPLLYRIGQELAESQNFDESVRALRLVVSIEKEVGNLNGQAAVLSDLATSLLAGERVAEAIRIYREEVLPLRLILGNGSDFRRTQRNIGLAYLRLKDAEACYSHLHEGLQSTQGPLSVEETELGLKTVLAAQEEGLMIPTAFLGYFRTIAEAAGLNDLERRFESLAVATRSVSFKRIRVFISYSHSDRQQVAEIQQFMPAQLFDVFLDCDRLYAGWTWEPVLLRTIQDSDVFLLLIGAKTLDSDYVNKELDTFLAANTDSAERGLIPVLIDGCGGIPRKVAAYQAVDLRGIDAQSRARAIGHAIHGAFFAPTGARDRAERRPGLPPEEGAAERLKQLWESGQTGLSPQAAAQMVNLGIVRNRIHCANRELDPATMQAKQCDSQAAAVCVVCVMGACDEPFHAYGRFCTHLPPGGLISPGTGLFYWCGTCHGPVCVRCLQIEDDYPCLPERVLSYRLDCPACGGQIQVVPVLEAGVEGAVTEFLRWVKAGGPPDVPRR